MARTQGVYPLTGVAHDEAKLEQALSALARQLHELELPVGEASVLVDMVTDSLTLSEESPPPAVLTLTGGRHWTAQERAGGELDLLQRSFRRRRELLAGALSTSQVAALLGTSRQTPHDRVAGGSLLAVRDRGGLRFPPWQFDPEGDDGVVPGLPETIRSLDVSPLAKMSWLTTPNPMLDGEVPLASLKAGHVERVVALARTVGVD